MFHAEELGEPGLHGRFPLELVPAVTLTLVSSASRSEQQDAESKDCSDE